MTIYQAIDELRNRFVDLAEIRTIGIGRDDAGKKWIIIWSTAASPPEELSRGRWRGWPVEVLSPPSGRRGHKMSDHILQMRTGDL